MFEEIKEILRREPIRYFDGRYSEGYVDIVELEALIDAGEAVIDTGNLMDFVRLPEPED